MGSSIWSSPVRRFVAICVFALVLHGAGTWGLPLVDRDEPRFAEATREMLERRDFLVPYFNDGYRFDKPIFIYWCQALSVRLWGESEWAVRLPSIVAAALTAGVLYLFGRRAVTESAGVWAALIFTTSLQTLVHAKMAVADVVLILFMTSASWAGWELLQPLKGEEGSRGPRNPWWWLFYLSLALGFLTKGPIAWLPVAGVIGGTRQERPYGTAIWAVFGMILVLFLVGLWGIPALLATHGEFFRIGIGRHVVQRSVGTLEGHGATDWMGYVALLPFYFITVFVSFFPWSWFLPRLVRSRWAISERPKLETYLLVGIALNFGIFSLIRTKLPHYTLPCFPLLSLWLAAYFPKVERCLPAFRRMLMVGTGTALLAGWVLIPSITPLFPSEHLYRQAEGWLSPGMEFASLDYDEPSLVWCFRRKVHGWHHPMPAGELAAFMARPGARFCVLPTDQISRVLPDHPTAWKSCRTAGFNFVHGRHVDLTLLVKLQ